MSSPAHSYQSARHPLRSIVVTSSAFLAIAFITWFVVLAADAAVFYAQVSRHAHDATARPTPLLGTRSANSIAYPAVFFVAALAVARWRRYRPGLSAFLGYAAFLAIYVPLHGWDKVVRLDFIPVVAPLVTSPLGALVAERLFPKHPTI
jgi:hypothetical protein